MFEVSRKKMGVVRDFGKMIDLSVSWDLCFRRRLTEGEILKFSELSTLLEMVVFTGEEDTLSWCNNDGCFTVKATAGIICETRRLEEGLGVTHFYHQSIWLKETPAKVNFFMWLLGRKSLLTDEYIKYTGKCFPSRCELCGQDEETLEHLFVDCVFSKGIWDSFTLGSRQYGLDLSSVDAIIEGWNCSNLSVTGRKLWQMLPHAIFWNLWLARNLSKFENVQALDWRVMQAIKTSIWSWGLEDSVLKKVRREDLMFNWDKVITN
ncbi:tRNA (guanine(10)-N(2))-methyltransferase [Ranunculus cassubicifolius]